MASNLKQIYTKSIAIGLIIGLGISFFSFLFIGSTSIPLEIENTAKFSLEKSTEAQANEINSILQKTEGLVKSSVNFASQVYSGNFLLDQDSYYHDQTIMSPPPDIDFDNDYQRDISYDHSVYKIAPTAFDENYQNTYSNEDFNEVDNPLNHISTELQQEIELTAKMDYFWTDIFQTHSEHSWLYMGSDSGFIRSYPWHGPYSRGYDPRIRPWYVGAVTGAKDVVLIMDVSGSMGGDRIENTKEAMERVLRTLGPRDQVSLITFSTGVTIHNDLEIASELKVNDLISKINGFSADGGTNINQAILDGLIILGEQGSDDRSPLIIFMTDGDPTEGETYVPNILTNVKTANQNLQAQLFVFGLGLNLEEQLLNDLSAQNNGETQIIEDSNDIKDVMNRYYEFFTSEVDTSTVWSWPYVDASGMGLIITASQSLVVNDVFKGVMAADLKLNDLIYILREFESSPNGYHFIYDSGGIAVIHPSFLEFTEEDWINKQEIRKPIEELETQDEAFLDLIKEKLIDGPKSALISYGNEKRVVAVSRIGSTSMRLVTVSPINDFLDDDKRQQIEFKNNLPLLIIGAIGIIGTPTILYLSKKEWN